VLIGQPDHPLLRGHRQVIGATLTIIPEEFSAERIGLDDVGNVLEAAIIKRRALASEHGLAIIAEGIA